MTDLLDLLTPPKKELSQTSDAHYGREKRRKNPEKYKRIAKKYKRRVETCPEKLERRRQQHARYAKERRERIRNALRTAKNVPCVDCKTNYPPEVMDFHHVRGEKKFTLGHAARGTYRTYQEIINEIEKCDILCSNCHRMRHIKD